MFASFEEMNYRQKKKRIIYLGLVIVKIGQDLLLFYETLVKLAIVRESNLID